MSKERKSTVTDYEKSVSAAFVAGGIVIPVIAVLLLAGRVVLIGKGDMGALLPFAAVIFGIGLIFVSIGIFKNISYKKTLGEFHTYGHFCRKLKGKITKVNDGVTVPHNPNRPQAKNSVVIAVCLVTDEERYYYSRRIMRLENIIGKAADIYIYPTGQYYVDINSIRHDAPEGAVVRDFRI